MATAPRRRLVSAVALAAMTVASLIGRSVPDARATDVAPATSPACAVGTCPETPRSTARPADPTAATGTHRWFVNPDHTLWANADLPYRAGDNKVLWVKPVGSTLVVTGHRLDGDAPPLTASIPCCYPDGYQASGLIVPSPGCWKVDAVAGDRSLSFTVRVEP